MRCWSAGCKTVEARRGEDIKEVVCPRCGLKGRLSIRRFRAKGHVYTYEVIVHKIKGPDGRRRTKYCIIRESDDSDYFRKFLIRPYGKSRFFVSRLSISKFIKNDRWHHLRHVLSSDFRALKLSGTVKKLTLSGWPIYEIKKGQMRGAQLDVSVESKDLIEIDDCRYLVKRFYWLLSRKGRIDFIHRSVRLVDELFNYGSFIFRSRFYCDDEHNLIEDMMRLCIGQSVVRKNVFFNYYITVIHPNGRDFFVKVWPWKFDYEDIGALYDILGTADCLVRVWRVFKPAQLPFAPTAKGKWIYGVNFVFGHEEVDKVAEVVDEALKWMYVPEPEEEGEEETFEEALGIDEVLGP